ncbi:MAG TPA: hypothetical protein ENN30_02135 [Candidatus Woesearchaeota archaeon]|nr:hypothetical protein [Candidatus Woesearchaeota archaeon]
MIGHSVIDPVLYHLINKKRAEDAESLAISLKEQYKNLEAVVDTGIHSPVGHRKLVNAFFDGITYLFCHKDLGQEASFEKLVDFADSSFKMGAIATYMWEYVSDVEDYWQTALETFNRRTDTKTFFTKIRKFMGDCDDSAGFTHYMSVKHGEHSYLLAMWGNDSKGNSSGHATNYLKNRNETIGTFGRISHKSSSIDDVAEYWYPDLRGWTLYEINQDGTEYNVVERKVFIGGRKANISGRKQMMTIDAFVKKLDKIDPEIKDIVEKTMNSYT